MRNTASAAGRLRQASKNRWLDHIITSHDGVVWSDIEELIEAAQGALDGWRIGDDIVGPMRKLRDVLK